MPLALTIRRGSALKSRLDVKGIQWFSRVFAVYCMAKGPSGARGWSTCYGAAHGASRVRLAQSPAPRPGEVRPSGRCGLQFSGRDFAALRQLGLALRPVGPRLLAPLEDLVDDRADERNA